MTQIRNFKILKKASLMLIVLTMTLLLFSSCKKKDGVDEVVTIGKDEEAKETSNPLIVDPVTDDIALDAFFKAMQAGEIEIANSYVWETSKENSFGAAEFWDKIQLVGYTKILEVDKENVGKNDAYSLYNVTMSFAIPEGEANSETAESIADGSIEIELPKENVVVISKEDAEIQEMMNQGAIREIYEALPIDDGKGESISEENESESLDSSEATGEAADENSEQAPADSEAVAASTEVDGGLSLSGKQTMLITVVKENGKYYVSPFNLLSTYEAEDLRSTQEIVDELNEEMGESVEEADAIANGVFAKLLSAKKYSDGLELKVRIENLREEPLYIGSDLSEATLALEGIVVGEGDGSSVEMAESYGFLTLGSDSGAIDSSFDTFAPVVIIKPGETETLEGIKLDGLFELVFSMGFEGVYSDGDEVTKHLPIEIPDMITTGTISKMGSPFVIEYEEATEAEMDLDELDVQADETP